MAFRGRRGLLVAAMLVSAISGATACTATGGTAVKVTTTGPATGSTAAAPSTSSGASGAGPATSPSTFPLPVAGTGDGLLWSQNAAQPLGQPVAVGDGVAVYVLRGSVLSIEVVDAATGKIRWQRPAATGAAAAGIEISPVLVGGHLVYLRPVQGSMTTTSVVVADAVTGKDIAVSQHDYRVGSRPVSCQHSVCFSVYVGTDQQAVNMDPATGQVISAGAGTGGRSIGPEGLQSVQDPDRPETLTRTKDSRTVWSTPLTNIFDDGYSTNGGWEFHVLPKQNMLIGSVGAYDPDQPFRGDINLGTALKMAGIDLATGARRWLQSGGVDYQCIPQAAVVEAGALVNVRCRWGAGTVAHRVGDKLTLRTASLSVEGFNPATGATTWTVPLADPTGQSPATAFHHIEVVGEDTLLVSGRTAAQLIDPVTGATRPVPADTQAVCVVGIETPLAGGERTVNGRTSNTYATGSKATRCTADGTPTTKPSATWPTWTGVTVHQVHVVTTTGGLQGYRN